jgi:hypothetical protein
MNKSCIFVLHYCQIRYTFIFKHPSSQIDVYTVASIAILRSKRAKAQVSHGKYSGVLHQPELTVSAVEKNHAVEWPDFFFIFGASLLFFNLSPSFFTFFFLTGTILLA